MPAAPTEADDRPASTDRLPTLTEVVELGDARVFGPAHGFGFGDAIEPVPEAPHVPPPAGMVLRPLDTAPTALPRPAEIDEAVLTERVLPALAPRIDALLEARLREALAPVLARAVDGLVSDVRSELSEVLKDLVQDALDRSFDRPA